MRDPEYAGEPVTIIEVAKGYYKVEELSLGASNLQRLVRYLKDRGYVIATVNRFRETSILSHGF